MPIHDERYTMPASSKLITEYQVDVEHNGDKTKTVRFNIIGDKFNITIGVISVDNRVDINTDFIEARFPIFLVQLGQLMAVDLEESKDIFGGFSFQESK